MFRTNPTIQSALCILSRLMVCFVALFVAHFPISKAPTDQPASRTLGVIICRLHEFDLSGNIVHREACIEAM